MIVTLPIKMLPSKIRTKKLEANYTWYWRDVAVELEWLLICNKNDEWFTRVQVRFKDGNFDFTVDALEIEELPTYKEAESSQVNIWLYLYYLMDKLEVENIIELINTNR